MTTPSATAPRHLLQRLVLVQPGEGRALLWAGAYFFFLLFSFYLLRPVREAMGIARGVDKLPWLMTGTMLVMIAAHPLYAMLVSKMPRRRFIPLISHFFAINLLLFCAAFSLLPEHGGVNLGYAFYIWLSVFNLFVVSVFWGLMADVFNEDQGKRLFGMISVGGTLGAVVGAAVTQNLSQGNFGITFEPAHLMLLAVVCLEVAVLCMIGLAKRFGLSKTGTGPREPGPDFREGLRLIRRSRYLQLICAYILLFAITSTFLYLTQGDIVARSFKGTAERTAAFAQIDVWGNVITLFVQIFMTSRLVRGLGVPGVLLILPVLTLAGFAALAIWPAFLTLAIIQVLRRGLHYSVDRPAREILYIPLGPEEKYKSKNFIDTVVYRAGDFVGVWAPTLMGVLLIPVTIAAVATSGAWIASGAWLGRLVPRSARAGQDT
ncbi:MAG: Npt1/Npt2 family nucleotide transporter [Pseudomonadota bacterium]